MRPPPQVQNPTTPFSFQDISTNTVARAIQSSGRNGPRLPGWLIHGQNFLVKLAKTCYEPTLKISRRHPDSCPIRSQMTKNPLQPKQESRHLPETLSTCSHNVSANPTKKPWPQLNQPASHGPPRPKPRTAPATAPAETFQKEKKW